MKVVFLDVDSLQRDDLDFNGLRAVCSELQLYERTAADQTATRIADAEVVISNKVLLDEAALQNSKNLKLICVAATGYNNVDLKAADVQNIAVCNVRAYATASVVQHVFTLILALTTRLNDYQKAVADGAWQRSDQFCLLDFPISELQGKVLGIVGYGELGHGIAPVARAFGMEVKIAARVGTQATGDRLDLDDLLPQVDVLTLHCPLTEETRNLIDARRLALMKKEALLINCARGGIVDETALADALRNGRLGGAGVDVLTTEPPVNGNPLLDPAIPNLIVTPHIAWASRQSRQRLLDQVVENILAFQQGKVRNRVG